MLYIAITVFVFLCIFCLIAKTFSEYNSKQKDIKKLYKNTNNLEDKKVILMQYILMNKAGHSFFKCLNVITLFGIVLNLNYIIIDWQKEYKFYDEFFFICLLFIILCLTYIPFYIYIMKDVDKYGLDIDKLKQEIDILEKLSYLENALKVINEKIKYNENKEHIIKSLEIQQHKIEVQQQLTTKELAEINKFYENLKKDF